MGKLALIFILSVIVYHSRVCVGFIVGPSELNHNDEPDALSMLSRHKLEAAAAELVEKNKNNNNYETSNKNNNNNNDDDDENWRTFELRSSSSSSSRNNNNDRIDYPAHLGTVIVLRRQLSKPMKQSLPGNYYRKQVLQLARQLAAFNAADDNNNNMERARRFENAWSWNF